MLAGVANMLFWIDSGEVLPAPTLADFLRIFREMRRAA